MQTLKIGINSTLSHATIFLTQRCDKALIIDIMFFTRNSHVRSPTNNKVFKLTSPRIGLRQEKKFKGL